ncbi:MAG: hypothetical protein HN413_08050 [Chloroflexi bacterium]|mgnify:CR=1 FL=1|jgi:hypothetical protein|nr:hypothetical protein [Chloroflexota bacterium]
MSDVFYYLGTEGAEKKLSTVTANFKGPQYFELKREDRTDQGTLKKDVIARKRRWTLTWSHLPSFDSDVVDYATGKYSLEQMYLTGGSLVLRMPAELGTYETVNVQIESFQADRSQVTPHYAWRVQMVVVEE